MNQAVISALLVDTHEAARVCGLSPSFLYRSWKGNPAARRAGRALRWDVNELKEWMREQAQANQLTMSETGNPMKGKAPRLVETKGACGAKHLKR